MATTQNKHEIESQLEQKYSTVISQAKQLGAKIEKSHVENGKLILKIAVPSDQVKNKIWDQAKSVDQNFADLKLDIHVEQMGGGGGIGQRTYTVQRGDTLSELSQKFYGKSSEYMKIYNANRDQLNDPDKIEIGQTLKIPE